MSYPPSGRAARRTQRSCPLRTLHLLDVENLTGTAAPGAAQARDLRARYTVLVPIGDLDQIVIASSHLTLKKTGCWWPGARYLVRSGPDGADLATARRDRPRTRQ